jgi:hypothetical protein
VHLLGARTLTPLFAVRDDVVAHISTALENIGSDSRAPPPARVALKPKRLRKHLVANYSLNR